MFVNHYLSAGNQTQCSLNWPETYFIDQVLRDMTQGSFLKQYSVVKNSKLRLLFYDEF